MRTEIYTLDRDDLTILSDYLPEYVVERSYLPGYFTLGAVGQVDEEDTLLGMTQFYININSDGECFAELVYIYVLEDYRHNGVGTRLIERVNRILKKSDIKTCMLLIPSEDDKLMGYETPGTELENFFKECSFITTKEEAAIWRATIGKLISGMMGKKTAKSILPLEEISKDDFTKLMETIVEKADDSDPVPEDLKIEESEYDGELSSYFDNKDSGGVLLMHRFGAGALEVVLLRGFGDESASRLYDLVVRSLSACEDSVDSEALVLVKDRAALSSDNIEKLMPGIQKLGMKKYVRLTSR